jgi:hypothetical protein
MFIFAFVACVSSAAGRRPEDRPIFNAAVDRLLLGDALAQLPADHRAVVRRAYQRCTTAQIARTFTLRKGREVEPARRPEGVKAAAARNEGGAVKTLRPNV